MADEAAPGFTGATELNCEVEEKMRMKRTPAESQGLRNDGFILYWFVSWGFPKRLICQNGTKMDGLSRIFCFRMDDLWVTPCMDTSIWFVVVEQNVR